MAENTRLLWWRDPRAMALPGYAWAKAELGRCEVLGQGIRDAYVRVEDGRIVGVGNIDVNGDEN